jgi:hypothetical protein
MQKILIILLGACFALTLNGQVTEGKERMSLGEYNAYTVVNDGADRKRIEKVWKDYAEDYGKVKHEKKDKEYYMEEANIKFISSFDALKIHIKYEENKNQTVTHFFFNDGSGYINSEDYPEESERIYSFLEDYQNLVAKSVVGDEVEDQEKTLKDLEKKLSKLEDKHKDYKNDIEKAEKKIREAEDNIEKNLTEQDDMRYEIESQRKAVQKVIDRMNSIGRNN